MPTPAPESSTVPRAPRNEAGAVYMSNETYVQLLFTMEVQNSLMEFLSSKATEWQQNYSDLELCIRMKAAEGAPALECLGDRSL